MPYAPQNPAPLHPTWRPRLALWALPFFALASLACGGPPPVAPAAHADGEQQAITAYSAEVPQVRAHFNAYLSALEASNEEREFPAYLKALREEVIPQLESLVAAVEAMPQASSQLKAIHTPLLSAYRDLQEAYQGFVDGATEAQAEQEYAAIARAVEQLKKAEEIYLSSIQAYYEEQHIRFESDAE